METLNGSNVHTESHKRVPHSFFQKTTSVHTGCQAQGNPSIREHDKSNIKNDCSRSARGSTNVAQFRVNNVSPTETRRLNEAHFQPQEFKLLCGYRQIQNDKYSTSTRLRADKRLGCKNRHSPSVLSCTCVKKSPALSTTAIQPKKRSATTNIPNDLLAFRTELGTKNICLDNQLDCTTSTRTRGSLTSIPGRFLSSASKSEEASGTHCSHHDYVEHVGLANKPREVCARTSKVPRVPRNRMGPCKKHQIPPGKVSYQSSCPCNINDLGSQNNSRKPAVNNRHSQLCELRCTEGSIKLSLPAETGQSCTKNQTTCLSKCRRSSRIKMVDRSLQRHLPYTLPTTSTLPRDRCERSRLGSQTRQQNNIRFMAKSPTKLTLQSKRNVGNNVCPQRSRSAPEFQNINDSMRQQDSSLIPSKRGRDKIYGLDESDNTSISDHRSPQHSHANISHSRHIQLRGGSSISTQTSPRVAPPTQYHQYCVQKVGHTIDRPLCIRPSPRSSSILHTRQERRTGEYVRCSSEPLEFRPSMGLSSTVYDTSSTTSPKYCSRGVPTSSPTLGTGVLEARPQKQSSLSPVHYKGPTTGPSGPDDRVATPTIITNDSRDMEMCGWNELLTDWSQQQKSLLVGSWRPSTMKTYKPAWKRWVLWANANNTDPHKPSGSDVARFLSDLHQKESLSLSTILVHKSVVSTFCDPNHSGNLSNNFLVKQVIKAITIAASNSKPKTKPPIWDVDIVLNHLRTVNPNSVSVFETSQITAALLLLLSGRRVHDLTLLSINSSSCVISDNHITFWPKYGSKTDTPQHQQSGWKLFRNTTTPALDPVHWVKHLIKLSKVRRESTKTDNLFISTCGQPKAATRTIIAGWIKKLLRDVGIQASPGSFRSAVASKSWLENCPVDEILSRGNWRSVKTFKKFYCKEVIPIKTNNGLLNQNLFIPTTD